MNIKYKNFEGEGNRGEIFTLILAYLLKYKYKGNNFIIIQVGKMVSNK